MHSQPAGFPRHFLIFLTAVSFSMTGVALYATLPGGAGVSADAARYMSTAENLLRGRGFFDFSGTPYVWWPPLYPLLLAAFSALTRLDVFLTGWFFNVALGGVNIALASILLYYIFEDSVWTYFGTLIFATSAGMLKMTTNVGSDTLFITLLLTFQISLGLWNGASIKRLVWLCALCALASLQRYLGVTLIATLAVGILIRNKYKVTLRIKTALVSLVSAFLPLGAWLIGHNYFTYGTFFGPRDYESHPWQNLINSAENILNWFYPFFAVEAVSPRINSLALVFLLGVLIFMPKRTAWLAWMGKLSNAFVLPGIIFMLFYLSVLVFAVNYSEHKYPGYDRFEIVILAPVLPLIFITLGQLVIPRLRLPNIIVIFIFVVWIAHPAGGLYQFVASSHQNGVSANNVYNLPRVKNSASIRRLDEIVAGDPQATIYSSNAAAVWFVTRREVLMPPLWEKKKKFDQAAAQQLGGWPGDKEGYLLWFTPDTYEIFATPQELSQIAEIELVFKTSDGEIYRVRALQK